MRSRHLEGWTRTAVLRGFGDLFARFSYVVENAAVGALAIFVVDRMPEALVTNLEMTLAIFINIMSTTYLVLAAAGHEIEFKFTQILLALFASWNRSSILVLILLLLAFAFVLCSLCVGDLFPLRIFC